MPSESPIKVISSDLGLKLLFHMSALSVLWFSFYLFQSLFFILLSCIVIPLALLCPLIKWTAQLPQAYARASEMFSDLLSTNPDSNCALSYFMVGSLGIISASAAKSSVSEFHLALISPPWRYGYLYRPLGSLGSLG